VTTDDPRSEAEKRLEQKHGQIGYDVLLQDRVEQLKLIDDRLSQIRWGMRPTQDVQEIRNEIALMIQRAEQESADF
jgi:hypothetical protein